MREVTYIFPAVHNTVFWFSMYRMHPNSLIQAATANKIMQKETTAKLVAAKKRREREQKYQREFVPRKVRV